MHEDDRTDRPAGAIPGPRPTPGPRPGSGDEQTVTDDAAVDQALARLDELDGLPVREHVAVFDAVHLALQDRLADIED